MGFGSSSQTDFMLQHCGEAVVIGGVPGYGQFELVDGTETDGDVEAQVQVPTLLVRRAKFPALRRGVTATVDGTDYTVREIARVEDPHLVRCILVSEEDA